MIYSSPREKKTAIVYAVLFLVIAFACGVLSASGIGIPGLWQILTAASLVTVIQISQRYLLSGYEYILDPADEINLRNRITVIRVQGERKSSVFTAPLAGAVSVEKYTGSKKLKKKYVGLKSVMNFCPDMRPNESYALIFEVNGEYTALRLQCGNELCEALEKRLGV